ncbi:MAG: response regulator [Elusimicrobia bacterium]|nr:response regulator [Elusimicrobiota bacterium]
MAARPKKKSKHFSMAAAPSAAQQALKESEVAIRALYNITSTQQLGFESKVQALLSLGRQRFNLETGVLAKIEDSRYEVLEGQSPENTLARGTIWELEKTFCERTIAEGSPLGIEHAEISPWKDHPARQHHQIEAYLGAKVLVGKQIFGTLSFYSQYPRQLEFAEAEKEFLQLMAQWVGVEMERRNIEAQLAQARDAAIESARLKSEFLANMSHEIRTPINAIIGMTALLQSHELNTQQRECTETIRASGEALLAIINDILDLSKIEAGKMIFENLTFDLGDLIESTLEILSANAQMKGIELISLIDRDIPPYLRGDSGRLRQILMNLVGNAIKFTDQGHVMVRASLARSTDFEIVIRVKIEDTGIGISPDNRRRLFQAFSQIDSSTKRIFGGTGLGLAISKKLIDLMEGAIGVESVPGQGSIFWFEAPFPKPPPSESVAPARDELMAFDILVVDDNAAQRAALQEKLSQWGIHSEGIAGGSAALAALRQKNPIPCHLALIDMQMPDMDGLILSLEMKSDPRLAKIPIVLMTSLARPIRSDVLDSAGIAAHLSKPLKQSSLYHCLAMAAGKKSAWVISLPKAQTSLIKERKYFRVLVVEDNSVNQKVALFQLRQLGYGADAVGNGQEALDALNRLPYHLVLMDCQMPVMDGYETTREIRRGEGGERRLPIIAMTAHALSGDRGRCLEAGMDGYLSKPVNAQELGKMLAQWDVPVNLPVIESVRQLANQEGDSAFKELIQSFITEASTRLVMMGQAMSQKNASALKETAHALKGASGSLGAWTMQTLCSQIEHGLESGTMDGVGELLEALSEELERVRVFFSNL